MTKVQVAIRGRTLALVGFAAAAVFAAAACYTPPQPATHRPPPPPPEPVPFDAHMIPAEDLDPWDDEDLEARIYVEREPMPPVTGDLLRVRMSVPAMLCVNCERAVAGLIRGVPGTEIVEINHETDRVDALVPQGAVGRVVRVLTTNGWIVESVETSRIDEEEPDVDIDMDEDGAP